MQSFKTEGIVLRTHDFGEANRIIVLTQGRIEEIKRDELNIYDIPISQPYIYF